MTSRTMVRTVRGWDIGLAAAILAVVLLGWLTAPGSNGAAPHSGQLAGPALGRAGDASSARPANGPAPSMTRPALPHQ